MRRNVARILTGRMQPSARARGGYRQYVTKLMRDRWAIDPRWEVGKRVPPVYAWVNQGSWAANCECGGSLIVEPDEPYICPDCVNAYWGGKARKVVFPKDREEIEKVLLNRPFPKNRNWLLTETANDLKRQNIEKGDKV